MQAACFLLVVATFGQPRGGNLGSSEKPLLSGKSSQLSRHSDRWFKNVQEASDEAKRWAYNQSLRVLPQQYRDVGAWKGSPPRILRLLHVSATCAAELARLAREEVMEAYQLSPSEFSAIETDAEIQALPPSDVATRFDPKKVRLPRAIEALLRYPESNPPKPIPSAAEVQMVIGKAQVLHPRREWAPEERTQARAEQQLNIQDKIRQIEAMKKRKAAAEKEVDRKFKSTRSTPPPKDAIPGPR